MNVRLLQRNLRATAWLSPGQYTTAGGGVAVCCPECGGVSELEQTPLASGEVPLEWRCPLVCTWEGRLRLEDWGEAVLR